MLETIGEIIKDPDLTISILALIVSIIALVASAIFYFMSAQQLRKSTRRLQRTMNVLGRYLKGTIKDAEVDLHYDKEGDIVGLDIKLRPEHISVRANVKGDLTVIEGKKKPD